MTTDNRSSNVAQTETHAKPAHMSVREHLQKVRNHADTINCERCSRHIAIASSRIAELIAAAEAYATDYMQDEADGSAYVCGEEQRLAAKRVFAALAACKGETK